MIGPAMDAASQRLYTAVDSYPLFPERNPAAAAAALAAIDEALAAGADPMALDVNQRPIAFSAAALTGGPAPLARLLDGGLALDVTCNDGTLLHRAAEFGRVATMEMLIARGLPHDVRDPFGRTPLMAARAWKHGQDALPLLLRLAQTAATPAVADGDDDRDLFSADVHRALARLGRRDRLFRHLDRPALAQLVNAFFADGDPASTVDLLSMLAEHDSEPILAAALALARVTRATPMRLRVDNVTEDLVILGDLDVTGDVDATRLVVTGNLRVGGRVANYHGAVIAVGGNLRAKAIWTEGPFVVRGDVRAVQAVWGNDNDYGICIGGALTAPVLVLTDHTYTAKHTTARRYNAVARIPARDRALLRRAFGDVPQLAA
jgi:hypothetical protein